MQIRSGKASAKACDGGPHRRDHLPYATLELTCGFGSPMRRREFITLLGGAAAAWPRVARAQQPERMRRIGVLMGQAEDGAEAQARVTAFEQGLQQLGWSDGRNVRIDRRWAAGDADALADMRRN